MSMIFKSPYPFSLPVKLLLVFCFTFKLKKKKEEKKRVFSLPFQTRKGESTFSIILQNVNYLGNCTMAKTAKWTLFLSWRFQVCACAHSIAQGFHHKTTRKPVKSGGHFWGEVGRCFYCFPIPNLQNPATFLFVWNSNTSQT